MRCFYVLKKWSSAKLSLNCDLSLNKVSLNRDCTVLSLSCAEFLFILVFSCNDGPKINQISRENADVQEQDCSFINYFTQIGN